MGPPQGPGAQRDRPVGEGLTGDGGFPLPSSRCRPVWSRSSPTGPSRPGDRALLQRGDHEGQGSPQPCHCLPCSGPSPASRLQDELQRRAMPSAPRPGPRAGFEGQGRSDAVGRAGLVCVLAGTASCSLCWGRGVSQRQGPNQAQGVQPHLLHGPLGRTSTACTLIPGLCLPPACLCPPGSWTGLRPHLLGSPLEPGFFWGPLRLDPHPSPSCLAQGGAGGLLGSWGGGQRDVLHLQPPLALALVPRLLL